MRATGDNRWELTPRGSRMIGQQALGEIYQRLKHQNLGNHAVPEEGRFGERLEQTKAYEFGDPSTRTCRAPSETPSIVRARARPSR